MRELYTLEIIRLVKELKSLEGFYVEQFYEIEKDRFRLKLSRKGEKLNLQCILPYTINRTEYVEVREDATNFSIAARKRIANSRVKDITQLNNDRIIMITLEKAGSFINIIFEMFGRGNMIITSPEMTITLAYNVHDYRDRSIRPGKKYEPPKNASINILEESEVDGVCKNMNSANPDSTIANYLNKRIGMGSMYLIEAITRCSINPEAKVGSVNGDSYNRISESINALIKECVDNPRFMAYEENDNISNFSLCSISKFSKLDAKECASLETCMDTFYRRPRSESAKKSTEEEKISTSIKKQESILRGIDEEIKAAKAIGNYIMKHMHELNSMISTIKSNKGITVEEIKEIPYGARILSMNKKTKTIRMEVDGVD